MNPRPPAAFVVISVPLLLGAASAGPAPKDGANLSLAPSFATGSPHAPRSSGAPRATAQLGPLTCEADLDASGNVGFGDLTVVLINWGPCPPGPCPWDLDASGDVGFGDLTIVLTTWDCSVICGPGAGSCLEAHASPGCANAACCGTVCALDPSCCDSDWDRTCADQAIVICGACSGDGDECDQALTAVTGPNLGNTLDNTGSTGDDSSCGSNDTIDEWWCWTAPCTGQAIASTCNQASFNTTIAVYGAACGSQIVCNDNSGCSGGSTIVGWTALAGTEYRIRVAGVNGATGTYTLTLSCSLIEGDECTYPNVLDGLPYEFAGSYLQFMTGASGDDTSCGAGDTIDEWWSWTAPCTGTATASTCDDSTDVDTTLAIYDACGGVELACNDDDPECSYGGGESTLSWEVTEGTEYLARVSGVNGAADFYILRIVCATPGVSNCCFLHSGEGCSDITCTKGACGLSPFCCSLSWGVPCVNYALANCDVCAGLVGDECEVPRPASTGANAGDTTDNTGSTGDDTSCGTGDTIDEWWQWTALCSGTATASTCGGASFDTTIAVYQTCGGSELACNDDAPGCGTASEVSWPVVGGTTYRIRVAGNGGASGLYTLDLSCVGCPTGGFCPCCEAHLNTGCNDAECEEQICAQDPLCCAVQWDQACADAAVAQCTTCAPAGDECQIPLHAEIGANAGNTTDNTGSTGDDTSCGTGDTIDEWWEWTATCFGPATASTCGQAGFNTTIAVFDDCGGTEVACNDDAAGCGTASEVTWAGVGGTLYKIRISGVGAATGAYTLTLSCASCGENCCVPHGGLGCGDPACEAAICAADPFCCDTAWDTICADEALEMCAICAVPFGDDCELALPAITGANSGDTTNDTGSIDDTTCGAGDTIDEWWCWVAPCDGTARASTCNAASFDTTVAVFDDCGGAQLACSDDTAGCGTTSMASWPVVEGTVYKIRVAGVNGSSGTYTLTVSCLP